MEEIKRLAMDIQFFAEENDDDETMDEDDLDNEELDNLTDDDNEEEESETDEEESAKEESKEESKEDKKSNETEQKKQSREENAKYKALRKESKRIQEESERAKELGKLEGIKMAYGGKNKFTGEELKDEYDIRAFMTQLEMEAEGLDPVEDYQKYVTNQERKRAEESKKNEKDKEWYANDRTAFVEAYPNVDLNDLINDEDFQLFSKGKVGITPLKEIYADYLTLVSKYEKKAKSEARKKAAKSMSSTGSVKNEEVEPEYYPLEEIKKYSYKDLQNLKVSDPKKYKKIMDSYDVMTKR